MESAINSIRQRGKIIIMGKEELYQEILKRAVEGKIACRQCFEIAKECDASLKIIGELCNEKNVKIHACQLGCFK